ncbi:MAG: hypothetical protein IRY87_24645 [Acetobacteraceae bacterium]|nr:hypothetical protein [Acetobacteraceae bacterium]
MSLASSRRSLLAGAAMLPVAGAAAAPASQPDAELIRLCEALPRAYQAWDQFYDANVTCQADEERLAPELDRLWGAMNGLLDQICDRPATGLAGLAAKAKASLVFCDPDAGDWHASAASHIGRSLVRDLLMLGGGAA